MTNKTKLPEFNGKPLIEVPKYIPTADFLEGDFGKAVLKEYQGRASSDYHNASALASDVLKYEDGVVKGSNPFAVVLINQIINQKGLRTATPADLERVLKTNALDLSGFYEDSALVLRSEENPNEYLAQNLTKQIKVRQSKNKIKYPVMIPLSGLELENDQNSEHGLAFKLTDEAEIIYAPILNKPGNFSSKDVDEKIGLPKKTGKGDRTLYTTNSGLSRLYLGRYLDLDSSCGGLADSDSDGRVVVVSAEGASQNFKRKIISEINEEYKTQLKELDGKREKALAVMGKK